MREFRAPTGVKVVGLFEAYDLCATVVKACRAHHCHLVSTLKSHRRRFKRGWKRKSGRDGRKLLRRCRTDPLDLSKPSGPGHDRFVDAGWLQVSTLGLLHVVVARTGTARTPLGLVTDAPTRSALDMIRPDEKGWAIAPWINDTKPLLGLGQYPNGSSWAAVTHLHLVCFADALRTHLRIERDGAQ